MFLLGILLTVLTLAAGDDNRNHNRIIGGYETNIKEHPYQVSLQFLQRHTCGGSILSAKFILTAGHCTSTFKKPVDYTVRVGSSYLRSDGKVHEVATAIPFPGFSTSTFDCDVGLYTLKTPIVFGETVRPIQLAPVGHRPEHGEILTTSGWGITSFNPRDNKASNVLVAIQLPAVKLDLCQQALKKCTVKVTENMICAGGLKGKLIYKGDSGGPLVNAKKELVGIASWGRGVEPAGFPSVFTFVGSPKVRRFILGVMNGTIA